MQWRVAVVVGSLFLGLECVSTAWAQSDTLITPTPPEPRKEKKGRTFSPAKATLLSAALPGAGQIYNRHYWKLPILYGGAATIGYFFILHNDLYITYRDQYIVQRTAEENGVPSPVIMSNGKPGNLSVLKANKDQRRQWRDLNVILGGLLYVLNIVDANVSAHLKNFTLSEDLSMSVMPGTYLPATGSVHPGITLTVRIK